MLFIQIYSFGKVISFKISSEQNFWRISYLVDWSWGPRLGISSFPIHSSSSTVMLEDRPRIKRSWKGSHIIVTLKIRVWEPAASNFSFQGVAWCCICPSAWTLHDASVPLLGSGLCWPSPLYFFCQMLLHALFSQSLPSFKKTHVPDSNCTLELPWWLHITPKLHCDQLCITISVYCWHYRNGKREM